MSTAFIGLDYIMDIADKAGRIPSVAGEVERRGVIEAANRALQVAKDKSWLTILVKVGFAPGYVEQPKASPLFGAVNRLGAIELGAPGTAFHPELRAELADIVVEKPRVSAFYCTKLEAILRPNRISRLVVAGVSSTWAVQATVREAHDRDYEVLVLDDACAAVTQEEHEISMKTLGAIARIVTLEEVLAL
jgi:nicotinamidase-related amidase